MGMIWRWAPQPRRSSVRGITLLLLFWLAACSFIDLDGLNSGPRDKAGRTTPDIDANRDADERGDARSEAGVVSDTGNDATGEVGNDAPPKVGHDACAPLGAHTFCEDFDDPDSFDSNWTKTPPEGDAGVFLDTQFFVSPPLSLLASATVDRSSREFDVADIVRQIEPASRIVVEFALGVAVENAAGAYLNLAPVRVSLQFPPTNGPPEWCEVGVAIADGWTKLYYRTSGGGYGESIPAAEGFGGWGRRLRLDINLADQNARIFSDNALRTSLTFAPSLPTFSAPGSVIHVGVTASPNQSNAAINVRVRVDDLWVDVTDGGAG